MPNRVKSRLGRICSEAGVTPFMALLAAFQILLHRYSDSDDVAVGSLSANRQQLETQGMIGRFTNLLVMRNDLSGDPSFRSLLPQVARTAIDAFHHQEMRYEVLARELQPGYDPTKQALAQVWFVFHQFSTDREIDLSRELTVTVQEATAAWESADVLDLALGVEDEPQGFHCQLTYDVGLFDHQTVARMAMHFQTLVAAIVADPDQRLSQLPLLTEREREQVLVQWNRTEVDFPEAGCVHQLFEAQVRRSPEAAALVFEGRSMSYRELNARANQLAHYLRRWNVGAEVLVGICLEPSPDAAVAILGVLKAGGAYVPLDPEEPRDRLDFFVADSRPRVIVTATDLAGRFSALDAHVVNVDADGNAIARESESDPPCQITPDNAVFVLYTSGSTGKPKGVVNLHRGVANYLLWKRQSLGLGPTDRVLLATPLSFDTSVEEFFGGLLSGGCMVIGKPGSQRDPGYLLQLLARERVTTACVVPSTLRLLLEENGVEQCGSLRRVISGGEALTPDLMERFFQRFSADLYNDYGPTETSIAVTTWKCSLDYQRGIIPIGRPIANVRLYILDAQRNPVPIGVPGELYVGGVAVARGYLNRPELNAERFLPDPFSGAAGDRIYRTGDRCRWLPDGNIQFLGRRDGQVKIHGGRLELGEVEAAINRHPGVAQAAVVVRQSSPDYRYLAAYVVPRGPRPDGDEAAAEFVKELRQFVKSLLPEYMIPQAFEVMDALPKLSSGKVDRAALPAAAPAARTAQRYVAPRSPLERQLAAIWAEVLQRDRVGIHDNFFDLGGHSLLAVRMMVQARTALAIALPVAAVFAAPTVAELAECIEAAKRGEIQDGAIETATVDEFVAGLLQPPTGDGQSLVPLRTGGAATPLFCFHGLGGHVAGFLPLAGRLTRERPVYGLQGQGLSAGQRPHDRIEAMAAFYLSEIREVQPHGPYLLAGWSMGGLIALEAANRLRAAGEEVALVA
ncbi:MAG: amino acid adenylation domain-containing protein, partial [Thermoguttaceae bacterium]